MKRMCSNCKHWKKYRRKGKMGYCKKLSRNKEEIYTDKKDDCEDWEEKYNKEEY